MSTKVVLIDDDIDTVEIFQDYLEMKGIEVIETGNNGKTAVELYLKHKPEIVLLDVMMPEYDGYFALENILKKDNDAKIIMVTADKTAETRKKLIELKVIERAEDPSDRRRTIYRLNPSLGWRGEPKEWVECTASRDDEPTPPCFIRKK